MKESAKQTSEEPLVSFLAYSSILSWVSFCETMLRDDKSAFEYISLRTMDAMIKLICFMHDKLDSDADNLVKLFYYSDALWLKEEADLSESYSNGPGNPVKLMLKMISHLLNHQSDQKPPIQIYTNFMRLHCILDCVIPKHQAELKKEKRYTIDIKTLLDEFLDTGIMNLYKSITDLFTNILDIYKETNMCQWYRDCKTMEDFSESTDKIVTGIATHTMGSAQFICDISRLLKETGEKQTTSSFIKKLTIPISKYRNLELTRSSEVKQMIPDIAPTSYRYESILRRYPILEYENVFIIPNYYEFFACIKEFPLRFNECFESSLSNKIRESMNWVYEFYVLELLKFTLPDARFIIIPEKKYKRGKTEVDGPDFTIIDKQENRIIIIEWKSGRTSNIIRDDIDHPKFGEDAKGIQKVLNDSFVKMDEIFECLGGYATYKDEIENCDKAKTCILYVRKDMGILLDAAYHIFIKEADPPLAERLCSHHYCLLDLDNLERLFHNFKATGDDLYSTMETLHKQMIGEGNTDTQIGSGIPIHHTLQDTVYYHHIKRVEEENSSKIMQCKRDEL